MNDLCITKDETYRTLTVCKLGDDELDKLDAVKFANGKLGCDLKDWTLADCDRINPHKVDVRYQAL